MSSPSHSTAPLLDVRNLSVAFAQGGRETLAVDRAVIASCIRMKTASNKASFEVKWW